MSQNRMTLRGNLPRRKPNRHRLGAMGQPPFVTPKTVDEEGNLKKVSREERTQALRIYNEQLAKVRKQVIREKINELG